MNKSKFNSNPWLTISAADYVGHMSSPEVGQWQMLNQLLKQTISKYKPKSLAVLGCTTGNGFEHINWGRTKKAVGFDINPEYLKIAEEKFSCHADRILFIEKDIATEALGEQEFDLIFGGLIFEYVPVKSTLLKIFRSLKPNGILATIIQLPDEKLFSVSKTKFTSLESLEPLMKLITAEVFDKTAANGGFAFVEQSTMKLESGKKFYYRVLTKNSYSI